MKFVVVKMGATCPGNRLVFIALQGKFMDFFFKEMAFL